MSVVRASRALALSFAFVAVGCASAHEEPRITEVSATPPVAASDEGSAPPPPPLASASAAIDRTPAPADDDAVVPPEAPPEIDPALAKELGPARIEELRIAESICATAVKRVKGKLIVGCRTCPPFRRDGGPDGKVEELEGDEDIFPIQHVYFGAFSAAGAHDAAVVFNGCESHAENYGGTLLVTQQPNQVWVSTSYRGGFHPDDCITFARPDARMDLVCQWTTEHQGFVETLVDRYDFSRGSAENVEAGWTHILEVGDTTYGSCIMGVGPDGVSVGSIRAMRIDTATADGKPRLVVTTRSGEAKKPPPAFTAKCKELIAEMDKDKPKPIDLTATIPAAERVSTFVWNTNDFVPDTPGKAPARPSP